MSKKVGFWMRAFLLAALFLVELPLTNVATPAIEQAPEQLTIVFDLDGVLFTTSTRSCARELGVTSLIRYKFFGGGNPEKIKNLLYDVLERCNCDGQRIEGVCDPDGTQLPGPVCSWLLGHQNCYTLKKEICQQIIENPQWFSCSNEQKLVRRTARLMFDPVRFAKTRQLCTDALPLVKRCKERGHRLVILSNGDRESFQIVQEKYQDLFDLFDQIIISGEVGLVKPMPEIFELLTKNAPAASCIFVDNQKENLHAAEKVGLHTILCKPTKGGIFTSRPNLAAVERKLVQLEAACTQSQTLHGICPLKS